jgi:hypothetical protein
LGLAFGLTLVMAIGPATGLAAVQSTGPAVTGTAPDAPCCGPTTPTGARLSKFLDGTGVDHLWLIGQRVNWETGETIAASTMPTTTHCSAFVAAIGERLGVYVLRPPQHGQILLANAQMSWLRDAGAAGGWRSLAGPVAAQAAANQGDLVLEAFSNPNPRRPGHIAIGPTGAKTNLRKGNAPMTKRAESKYKINRRLGVNLWGRPKSPINKREYGPGQHGQRRKKPTDFGVQLMAKQKLKGYYGNIGEKQFRKYYEEAVRRRGDTSENLIELLERRLDAVIYRLKFAITPFAARQFVSHGHVW